MAQWYAKILCEIAAGKLINRMAMTAQHNPKLIREIRSSLNAL
jgi:hypothetical protein